MENHDSYAGFRRFFPPTSFRFGVFSSLLIDSAHEKNAVQCALEIQMNLCGVRYQQLGQQQWHRQVEATNWQHKYAFIIRSWPATERICSEEQSRKLRRFTAKTRRCLLARIVSVGGCVSGWQAHGIQLG